ncbi:hypothetical protein MICCA_2020001 [Microcystis aeruginosa PCC 9432]|uniref:Uncharacterized protein n=1 Tax=Microcystis aeruginosa PCC 9432 TaxID=1160280 RepID=A0A822L8Z1_MICAE|nr:hypothetical protein MICCA_2020001 [Microcystis aeruginosa PCC 9432]
MSLSQIRGTPAQKLGAKLIFENQVEITGGCNHADTSNSVYRMYNNRYRSFLERE